MAFLQAASSKRRRVSGFGVSAGLHIALLIAILWQPLPPLVQPSSVRFGEHGSSVTPIYFARRGAEDLMPADTEADQTTHSVRYPVSLAHKKSRQLANGKNQQAETNRTGPKATQGPQAGSPFGSLAEGPSTGEEVKPALPIYGPQPQIASYEIPSGLEGDIVVEITIDNQGSVTQTLLLRGLGHGLDEKVLAILPTWRFHPATRDGMPIASRQDVYFHFPHPA